MCCSRAPGDRRAPRGPAQATTGKASQAKRYYATMPWTLFGQAEQVGFTAWTGPQRHFEPMHQVLFKSNFQNSFQTSNIHIYLNICPKFMKLVLLHF
jgi:hypothetical protein